MALADVPLDDAFSKSRRSVREGRGHAADPRHARRRGVRADRDLTVGEFREWLLAYETTTDVLARVAPGVTPEMAAAVSKVMRNQDLVLVASKCRVVTRFRNTLGLPGRLSVRLQPNHPTDDPRASRRASSTACSTAAATRCIGINPATDNVAATCKLLDMLAATDRRYEIPTQSCVLAHVTTTLRGDRAGAPVDLVFQSIAGTEAANASFGINLELLREAREAALSLQRGTVGDNVMYFETGQGSALSADAHHGVDQQTLEARAYAVARAFRPLLVNTRRRVHRARVPVRRQADHPRRAGGSLLRQAARPADGRATSATPTTPRPTRTTWTCC